MARRRYLPQDERDQVMGAGAIVQILIKGWSLLQKPVVAALTGIVREVLTGEVIDMVIRMLVKKAVKKSSSKIDDEILEKVENTTGKEW